MGGVGCGRRASAFWNRALPIWKAAAERSGDAALADSVMSSIIALTQNRFKMRLASLGPAPSKLIHRHTTDNQHHARIGCKCFQCPPASAAAARPYCQSSADSKIYLRPNAHRESDCG